MKSYNNLYDYPKNTPYFIDYCVNETLKNKYHRKDVEWAKEHRAEVAKESMEYFYNYYTKPHRILKIEDGNTHKIREIMVPADIPEQVVHHMVIATLQDKGFFKGLYPDSYGSIPGKGPHYGRKIIKNYIHHCVSKDGGKDIKYYLKTDISKYFPSIPHDIIKSKLAEKIRDKKFLKLLYDIIDVTGTDRGLPIGFFTSQWFANWYLTDFDHFMAEHLMLPVGRGKKQKMERIKVRYFRYMDDMVIFSSNKNDLWKIKDLMIQKLKDELGLTVKPNWVIHKFSYVNPKTDKATGMPLDFMGFKFYRNRVTLRKSILHGIVSRSRRYCRYSKVIKDHQSIMYARSYLKYSDTYSYAVEHIYPNVNFKDVRKRISTLTKLNNAKKETKNVNLVQK